MESIKSVLGNNIRALRKEAGWTQECLAEKANISVPFMTQIELGRKSASLEVIESIACALGVPYGDLFAERIPAQALPAHSLFVLENKLVEALRSAVHSAILATGAQN